jgi:hypothetical protein
MALITTDSNSQWYRVRYKLEGMTEGTKQRCKITQGFEASLEKGDETLNDEFNMFLNYQHKNDAEINGKSYTTGWQGILLTYSEARRIVHDENTRKSGNCEILSDKLGPNKKIDGWVELETRISIWTFQLRVSARGDARDHEVKAELAE